MIRTSVPQTPMQNMTSSLSFSFGHYSRKDSDDTLVLVTYLSNKTEYYTQLYCI